MSTPVGAELDPPLVRENGNASSNFNMTNLETVISLQNTRWRPMHRPPWLWARQCHLVCKIWTKWMGSIHPLLIVYRPFLMYYGSRIAVNIPTIKHSVLLCAFCSYTMKVVRLDVYLVGWRLACGEDERGWPARVPQEIRHFSCRMSAIWSPSISRKDHFMGTAKFIWNADFFYFSVQRAPLILNGKMSTHLCV